MNHRIYQNLYRIFEMTFLRRLKFLIRRGQKPQNTLFLICSPMKYTILFEKNQ